MTPPQFTTKTLLLITAVAAILCGGIVGFHAILPGPRMPLGIFVIESLALVPLWLPYAFIGFAIGRKRLSVAMVMILALTEAIALAIAYGIIALTSLR